jgi:hypothetical protein
VLRVHELVEVALMLKEILRVHKAGSGALELVAVVDEAYPMLLENPFEEMVLHPPLLEHIVVLEIHSQKIFQEKLFASMASILLLDLYEYSHTDVFQ